MVGASEASPGHIYKDLPEGGLRGRLQVGDLKGLRGLEGVASGGLEWQ